MDDTYNIIKSKLNSLGILKINEPLKNYTSFKTGGNADFLIWPRDRNSLKNIISVSKEYSIKLTVLGGCTNLLVGDSGIRGIVIMMNSFFTKGIMKTEENGSIYSDSIVRKQDFLNYCIDSGYENMEFMAGLPGCIGGGIIMNAGTYDGNFVDILESIDRIENGKIKNIKISKDMAGYRKMDIPDNIIILGGYFKLNKTNDIQSVRNKVTQIINDRKANQPLEYPSAGSVFKNPAGYFSWKLIDDSGLKGKSIGGACVSTKHTNFIINTGNARSQNILDLINYIKEQVFAKFNILLEPEVKIIGEF